jgi:hypothetical protein
MARPKFKGILDLGNPDTNRRCRNWIAARKGLYRVGLEPAGDTRTNRQLSYWWPCVVGPFYERLRENEAPNINCEEDAHDLLRGKLLTVPAEIDPRTGEATAWRTRRTGELTVEEFGDFMERARDYLLNEYKITTEDPDKNWRETKQAKQKQLTAANAAETRTA